MEDLDAIVKQINNLASILNRVYEAKFNIEGSIPFMTYDTYTPDRDRILHYLNYLSTRYKDLNLSDLEKAMYDIE